jgi:hypothetical protein
VNAQQLVAFAKTRDVTLTRAEATALVAHYGADLVEDLVAMAGSLMDLAGALGRELQLGGALEQLRRFKHCYDDAAAHLLEQTQAHRSRVFSAEFTRLEKDFWTREARARHATLAGLSRAGTLGFQVSLLLRAAEDAGLDAASYRAKLSGIVETEVGRRYPVRREAAWQVVDPDSGHAQRVQQAIRDEQQARDLVLLRRPELARRVDALGVDGFASVRLKREVRRVLNQIRTQLSERAAEGWMAQPELYMEQVVQAAASIARTA